MYQTTRLALIASLWLGLFPGTAMALSYLMMSDEALLGQSQLVVKATVREQLTPPAFDPDTALYTLYQVDVHEVLVGQYTDPTLTVRVAGRAAGQGGWYVPGAPHMRSGQPVLLFLVPGEQGQWQPVQLVFGVFFEQTLAGERLYLRSIDLPTASPLDKSLNAAYGAPRWATGFEDWLRGNAVSADDYLAPQTRHAKFLISIDASDSIPIRWFSFDEGITVNWYAVQGGQAGASYDEFAALQDALAAWVNDPGSQILLNYAGTVASASSQTSANTGVVVWDDPNNQIPGAWTGIGGTLAFGGPIYSTGTQLYNGVSHHPTVRGIVVTQDGAALYFNGDSGRDGAEVLTHELGHTLSFDHPCSDATCTAAEQNATMYADAHGDGRGASIQADDRAAALFLYRLSNPDLLLEDDFESP